jgi:hypothetical protein
MPGICEDKRYTRRKSDRERPHVALFQALTLLGFLLIFTFGKSLLTLIECSCICR